MTFNKDIPIAEWEATKSINKVINAGTTMKKLLNKTMLMKDKVTSNEIHTYLGEINSFLRDWSEYGESLQEKMKHTKAKNVSGKAIEYGDIKEYMYASYDYASVLPFTDGLIKSLDADKFDTAEDVSDFFEYTIGKAFKDRESNAGMVMSAVMPSMDAPELEDIDTKEIALYNACHNYKWYNMNDRIEIYKSIEATINFICEHYSFGKVIDVVNGKNPTIIRIAVINNIIDYINYTLTIYACRIFIIAQYAFPYIFSTNKNYDESVEDNISNKITDSAVTAFNELEDATIRDIEKFDKSLSAIGMALSSNGCNSTKYPTNADTIYYINFNNDNNVFCNKFKSTGNLLHDKLNNAMYLGTGMPDKIAEINQLLDSLAFNGKQALSMSYSPKQEIMSVIKNLQPVKNTVESYRSFMEDLTDCILSMCSKLNKLYNDANHYYDIGTNANNTWRVYTPSTRAELFNIQKISKDLYSEFTSAMLARLRDLENELNHIHNAKINNFIADTSINIPGIKFNKSNNINTNIPDTVRVPMAVIDIMTKPTYEYMTMYDEYVQYKYGLDNDVYYTEGWADVKNVLDSLITTLIQKIQKWFTGTKFTMARKWVQANQNNLKNMTYTGKLTNVIDYSDKINIDVYLSPFANKIKNVPSQIDNQLLIDSNKVEKMIKELYCNKNGFDQNLYNVFHDNNTDGKTKQNAYTNYVLFGKETDTIGKVEMPKLIEIDVSDANFISTYLQRWINTILSTENVYKQLNTELENCNKSIKEVNAKIVELTKDTQSTSSGTQQSTQQTSQQTATTSAPPSGNDNTTKTENFGFDVFGNPYMEAETSEQTSAKAEPAKEENKTDGNATPTGETNSSTPSTNKGSNASILSNGFKKACTDIVFGIYWPLTKAISDQYNYIKLAYTLGRK